MSAIARDDVFVDLPDFDTAPPERPGYTRHSSSERVSPANVDLEMCVLGAVMLEPRNAYAIAADFLTRESFYLDYHGLIFELCGELHAQGIPPDSIAVLDTLRKRGLLERVGGSGVVMGMLNSVPTAASIEYHSRLVAEKAQRRNLIRGCTRIIEEAYKQELHLEQLMDLAESTVEHVQAGCIQPVNSKTPADLADPMLARFDKRRANIVQAGNDPVKLAALSRGLPTGLHDLDRQTGGFTAPDLTIMAARPSMGKTALALNCAEYQALKGYRVGFISLEMDTESLFDRLVCGEFHRRTQQGIALKDVRFPVGMPESRVNWVRRVHMDLKTAIGDRLMFVDDTGNNFDAIIAASRELVKSGCKAIYYDYLQLIGGSENRNNELASYTRRLKNFAKRHKVPLIVLSQLSRQNVQNGAKPRHPILSDLRESGAIEQDADLVIFVRANTPLKWEPEIKPDGKPDLSRPLEGQLDLAKNRNGETGLSQVLFMRPAFRFLPVEIGWGEPRIVRTGGEAA